jgi:hypothetical protein
MVTNISVVNMVTFDTKITICPWFLMITMVASVSTQTRHFLTPF